MNCSMSIPYIYRDYSVFKPLNKYSTKWNFSCKASFELKRSVFPISFCKKYFDDIRFWQIFEKYLFSKI